ncbi:MAG: hypothetical protein ACYC63_15255 [Armatimonadota bacterium]
MRSILLVIVALALMTSAVAEVNVPLQKLQPASTSGFTATCKAAADALAVSFKKTGEERRFLAVQGVPGGNATGAKMAEISYRLDLTSGQAPRAAVLAYEKTGGSWYKIGGAAVPGADSSARVSVAALTETAFSSDANKQLDWDQVDRVWVGFIFEGAAEGKLTVTGARLTDQAVLPTQPLRLTGAGPGKWSAGQDPAVKANLTMAPEGPGGRECMKYQFTVPGGRHMYAIPSVTVEAEDPEGYKSLRFKYRAQIPAGMKMLISVGESGGPLYYVERSGPWPAEWSELTLPLDQFKWATWSTKDDNEQFDVGKLTTVQIGTHGGAAQAGDGFMMACDLELVP